MVYVGVECGFFFLECNVCRSDITIVRTNNVCVNCFLRSEIYIGANNMLRL